MKTQKPPLQTPIVKNMITSQRMNGIRVLNGLETDGADKAGITSITSSIIGIYIDILDGTDVDLGG